MKVLLIGNGAREHAIAASLAQDCELFALMSKKNPAIARLCKEHWVCDIESPEAVAKTIEGKSFDLGFSSPDATLAAGISDVLGESGMAVASPSKAASRIEWDKAFMRSLLDKHSLEGRALHEVVDNESDALRVIRDYNDVAIKPLGLTGGKGVKVSGDHFDSVEEGLQYVHTLLKTDGRALIEEKLVGEEFSFQCFSDGERVGLMPPVQDHKRAFEGDRGPNTGGMGSYSAGRNLPFLRGADLEEGREILQGVVGAMAKEGTPFVGVLYGQFMATKDGLKIVEFNARFGDPEAMNVLSLLQGSLSQTFMSMAKGSLKAPRFSDECTVLKYLVPDGYPGKSVKDAPLEVDHASIEKAGAQVYYAAVYEKEGQVLTTGSRAFGILGKADSLDEAERIAESACSFVKGPLWHRKDIGTGPLIARRVRHMEEIRSS